MVMTTTQQLTAALESNLEYAKLLLVPVDSGLDLLDKDAGTGNLDNKTWGYTLKLFDSLHLAENYYNVKPFIIDLETLRPYQFSKEFPPTKETIKVLLEENRITIQEQKVFTYPKLVNSLRSKVKTILVTSGSIKGFKTEIQHTAISRQSQTQTLREELKPQKKTLGRGKK